MRIVQVAPLEEPVPPKKYGGTELVIYNLIEEMVKLGHEVYLIGTGDSKTSATQIPVIEKSLRSIYNKDEIHKWRDFLKIFHLPDIIKHINDLEPDIVHNHYAWRLLQFSDFINCPIYTTIHGPLESFRERHTYSRFKQANYISISDNQRKAMPDLNWVKTIYNGIDINKFSLKQSKGEYFSFLGRTSPSKGLKEICQLIKGTDHKLKIAAKIDPVDEQYYQNEIKPLIDGEQIEFIGEVDHQGKVEFLSRSKGLLLWLNWEEPFGLVVIEAMACGVPVIVRSRGAMPEIVVQNQTGFLVNSLEEMRQKLDQVQNIDPKACREHVEKRFSAKTMAREYLKLAGKLTA